MAEAQRPLCVFDRSKVKKYIGKPETAGETKRESII